MIRVAVADDSSFIRRALARILSEENGIQLVGTAVSGEELLDHLERWRPDAIILDLSMPGMGGLPTLDRIMATWPTPVIILSTHSKRDAPQTIEALHRGAMDFVDKQEYSLVDFDALRGVLLEKLRQVTGMVGDEPDDGSLPPIPTSFPEPHRAPGVPAGQTGAGPASLVSPASPAEIKIALLGASTGGPPAIERILRDLGASISVPVAVVQHMPAGFTASLASRLDSCARAVTSISSASRPMTSPKVQISSSLNRPAVIRSVACHSARARLSGVPRETASSRSWRSGFTRVMSASSNHDPIGRWGKDYSRTSEFSVKMATKYCF